MARLYLALIAVLGSLSVVSNASIGQTPTKDIAPKSNQVYVKVIWPTDAATRNKDRPVVESWIADQLKKSGQSKFTAATSWVPVGEKGKLSSRVWNAVLDGQTCGCPVSGRISERTDGRIKVLLTGWSPGYAEVTVSLTDEPGSREIAAVERLTRDQGLPYVAVLIGPPPENSDAPTTK